MSDVSVVSQEYKTASELSKVIDNALLFLKKMRLTENASPPGGDSLIPSGVFKDPLKFKEKETQIQNDLEDADLLTKLHDVLEEIILTLETSSRKRVNPTQSSQIPANIIARIREERRGDLEYYLDDLKQTSYFIDTNPKMLTAANLVIIDHLSALVDTQATTLFRRLMRR